MIANDRTVRVSKKDIIEGNCLLYHLYSVNNIHPYRGPEKWEYLQCESAYNNHILPIHVCKQVANILNDIDPWLLSSQMFYQTSNWNKNHIFLLIPDRPVALKYADHMVQNVISFQFNDFMTIIFRNLGDLDSITQLKKDYSALYDLINNYHETGLKWKDVGKTLFISAANLLQTYFDALPQELLTRLCSDFLTILYGDYDYYAIGLHTEKRDCSITGYNLYNLLGTAKDKRSYQAKKCVILRRSTVSFLFIIDDWQIKVRIGSQGGSIGQGTYTVFVSANCIPADYQTLHFPINMEDN